MPTPEDLDQRRRRRGWWLRVSRDAAGLSLKGVTTSVGLSEKSASTVSDWERGEADPSIKQLELLSALYGQPLEDEN